MKMILLFDYSYYHAIGVVEATRCSFIHKREGENNAQDHRAEYD